jgi:hypothetical protein
MGLIWQLGSSGILFIVLYQTQNMDNRIGPENNDAGKTKPVASDTTEVVRRHLEDKNHEITDEEIRNIRIVGKDNEPITVGAEAEAKFVEGNVESEIDEKTDLPDTTDKPATPWDIVK